MRDYKLLIAGMAATALLIGACNVEQEEEGKMPDVDVEYEEGQLPEYEIRKTEEGRMPEVDVDYESGKMPEYDVEGPDVDIGTKEKVITVPDVDISMPEDDPDIEEDEEDGGSN